MTSIIADHKFGLNLFSSTVTAAQQSLVDAQLASHPIAKIVPEITSQIAAAHGWPVTERRPSPGAVLLNLAKG